MLAQNVYYRRTRRLDIPLITDIQLLPDGQSPPSSESWKKIGRSIRDGVTREPPLFMWYLTGKSARDLSAAEKQTDVITELDILYGSDRPWYGFEKIEPSVTLERSGRVESEWLSYRKGVKSTSFCPEITSLSHSILGRGSRCTTTSFFARRQIQDPPNWGLTLLNSS